MADWNTVYSPKLPVLSTAPKSVLKKLQVAMWRTIEKKETKPLIVITSRAGETMRHLIDEGKIITTIQSLLPHAKVVLYKGRGSKPESTRALFHHASVVSSNIVLGLV